MNAHYRIQVDLLLSVLPLLGQEKVFAIKGGTAINLFLRGLPRLSVDIDLTYLPLQPREKTLSGIDSALNHLASQIGRFKPRAEVQLKRTDGRRASGLLVGESGAVIKIESNVVFRGTVFPPTERDLHPDSKRVLGFDEFLSIPILSVADCYGGKICAALDRQHPRDLFDVMVLYEHEGITEDIRKAFLVYLASHDRPMHELLSPRRIDIRDVFKKEFRGMTDRAVTCEQLEYTREQLIKDINTKLIKPEREFLVSIKKGTPKWNLPGIPEIGELPALQWKIINTKKMSGMKQEQMLNRLKSILGLE